MTQVQIDRGQTLKITKIIIYIYQNKGRQLNHPPTPRLNPEPMFFEIVFSFIRSRYSIQKSYVYESYQENKNKGNHLSG